MGSEMADPDRDMMRLALELAARGRGAVEPNPMVGAVIARGTAEIARGWHRRFGGPHAEVEALDAARAAGADVRGATVYVSLEPCCHAGKTPPCTEALIRAGVGRVVAAMVDPDPQVAGRGLRQLRDAGITVTEGVCEAQARRLLAAYVKLRTVRRPWVICKWAQTADGFLALPRGRRRWVSGEPARRRVHELRSRCDGVLVGVGTVLADDPLLTNRSGRGKQPARVVLDSRLRTPADSRLVRSGAGCVLVATTAGAAQANRAAATLLRRAGAELIELPRAAGGVCLEALLDELGRRQWTYLLVEGGPRVLGAFCSAGLADELMVFVSAETVGAGPPDLPRFDLADLPADLPPPHRQPVGRDVLMHWVLGPSPKHGA